LTKNQIEPTPEFPLLQFPFGKKIGVKGFGVFCSSKSMGRKEYESDCLSIPTRKDQQYPCSS